MRILPSVTLAAALAATSLTLAVTFSAPALKPPAITAKPSK
jgi:hypothetical protein